MLLQANDITRQLQSIESTNNLCRSGVPNHRRPFKLLLEEFHMQLMHEGIAFDANGFFEVNLQLVMSVIEELKYIRNCNHNMFNFVFLFTDIWYYRQLSSSFAAVSTC